MLEQKKNNKNMTSLKIPQTMATDFAVKSYYDTDYQRNRQTDRQTE